MAFSIWRRQAILFASLAVVAFCTSFGSTNVVAKEVETSIAQDKVDAFLSSPDHLIISTADKNHPLQVELAIDEKTRATGLMFRTKMAENEGMLFDFGEVQPIYMWMKNTFVSLDMLFIQPDGTISHIVKKTTPLSLSIIGSAKPARYVLEVKSGTAERLSVEVGDKVRHKLFTPNSAN